MWKRREKLLDFARRRALSVKEVIRRFGAAEAEGKSCKNDRFKPGDMKIQVFN
jgi:hypothetical protein